MGNSKSVFTEDKLEEYQDLTFLSREEILHIFDRFKKLVQLEHGSAQNYDWTDATQPILSKNTIMTDLPELRVNPFKERICDIFAPSKANMSFEDFLDMMSVFSDRASKKVKTEYAFRIYDFNNDSRIGKEDLEQMIKLLIGDNSLDGMDKLIEQILDEGDFDGDEALSFAEFQHILSKTPDFVNLFRIRL